MHHAAYKMPPRPCFRLCSYSSIQKRHFTNSITVQYANASAVAPAPDQSAAIGANFISRSPNFQPPSHKPPHFRRSQLLRQYISLLESAPLILIFQHNNLKALEWLSIRRELDGALRQADHDRINCNALADYIKISVIHTGVFGAALRIVEYFEPRAVRTIPTDDQTAASVSNSDSAADSYDTVTCHGLSSVVHRAVFEKRKEHPLLPLLSGPIAVVTFPTISIEHLKTVMSILTPKSPDFAAPAKRTNPGYYEASVQAGLQKLIFLGARVEGSVLDVDKTRWVGSLSGGLDGLRAHVLSMLSNSAVSLTSSLEAGSKNVYFTLDNRRHTLEGETNST